MMGTVYEGDSTLMGLYMKETVHQVDCTRRRRYMTGTVYMKGTVQKGGGT